MVPLDSAVPPEVRAAIDAFSPIPRLLTSSCLTTRMGDLWLLYIRDDGAVMLTGNDVGWKLFDKAAATGILMSGAEAIWLIACYLDAGIYDSTRKPPKSARKGRGRHA